MDITLQSAQLNQASGSVGSPVRVTFTPPLQPDQAHALQGTTVQAKLAIPRGQSNPVLILPTGEQIPVKLEPQPALPQNINLRLQSATQAAAQIIKSGNQSPQVSTTVSSSTSSFPIPTTLTNVPTSPLAAGPQIPINTPTLMVNITPPSTSASQSQLQTLSALTTTITKESILSEPARVQIQPPSPLPLGTRTTLTLTTPNTATLTNIKVPTPAAQTTLSSSAQIQPLPTVSTPPLPTTSSGIAQILTQSSVILNTETSLPASTFTVRSGALLPNSSQHNSNSIQQYLPLPSAKGSAILQTPQPLPQNTPITLQVSQLTPTTQIATITHISNTHTTQTTQQLPPPITASTISKTPTPPILPAGQLTNLTVTQQNGATLTLQTAVGEKISIQWPNQHTTGGLSTSQASQPVIPPVGTQISGQLMVNNNILELQILSVSTSGVLPTPQHVTNQYSQQWPTLTQAISLLQQGSSDESTQLKKNIPTLATPPANFTVQMLATAEASKTSNINKFMSDDLVNLLRQLGVDFTPDLANLSTIQNRQENDGWRGFLFPYVENEQDDARQGSFFYRQNKNDEDNENTSTQTRFIVQIALSELGDIALDGIYTTQEKSKEKALHLRLHTDKEWPEDMISALTIFTDALFKSLEINGQFSFTNQTLLENPLSE